MTKKPFTFPQEVRGLTMSLNLDRYSDRHLCRHCGIKLGNHSGPGNPLCPEGRCPAVRAWGQMAKFPSLPKKMPPGSWRAGWEWPAATMAKYDKALEKFWTQQITTFAPVHSGRW